MRRMQQVKLGSAQVAVAAVPARVAVDPVPVGSVPAVSVPVKVPGFGSSNNSGAVSGSMSGPISSAVERDPVPADRAPIPNGAAGPNGGAGGGTGASTRA